jgi:hypothetical protein
LIQRQTKQETQPNLCDQRRSDARAGAVRDAARMPVFEPSVIEAPGGVARSSAPSGTGGAGAAGASSVTVPPAAQVFAQFEGTLSAAGESQQIHFAVTPSNFTLEGDKTVLGFQLIGDGLDPAPVEIRQGDGTPVTPLAATSSCRNIDC